MTGRFFQMVADRLEYFDPHRSWQELYWKLLYFVVYTS